MTDHAEGAFPTSRYSAFKGVGESDPIDGGLSKREYFAGIALQGLLANSSYSWETIDSDLIGCAVKYADKLIEQLNAIAPDSEENKNKTNNA